MKFSIKDFFSKWDQMRRKLRIWLHLLKQFLMENSFFVQWLNICNSFIEIFSSLEKWKSKTLIRSPVDTGPKLNVLCTFNLRPVSTGSFVIVNKHSYTKDWHYYSFQITISSSFALWNRGTTKSFQEIFCFLWEKLCLQHAQYKTSSSGQIDLFNYISSIW